MSLFDRSANAFRWMKQGGVLSAETCCGNEPNKAFMRVRDFDQAQGHYSSLDCSCSLWSQRHWLSLYPDKQINISLFNRSKQREAREKDTADWSSCFCPRELKLINLLSKRESWLSSSPLDHALAKGRSKVSFFGYRWLQLLLMNQIGFWNDLAQKGKYASSKFVPIAQSFNLKNLAQQLCTCLALRPILVNEKCFIQNVPSFSIFGLKSPTIYDYALVWIYSFIGIDRWKNLNKNKTPRNFTSLRVICI